jgi:hypothetical protein
VFTQNEQPLTVGNPTLAPLPSSPAAIQLYFLIERILRRAGRA